MNNPIWCTAIVFLASFQLAASEINSNILKRNSNSRNINQGNYNSQLTKSSSNNFEIILLSRWGACNTDRHFNRR